MGIADLAERLMRMDDRVWLRHANPWSVWSRFSCLPLLVLAIWSRQWIGIWSLIPVAAALVWIYLNPRVFPPATRFDNWAAQGTLGERVFLHQKSQIAPHHERATRILLYAPVLGLLPLVYGLWVFDPLATILGTLLSMVLKLWFVDRMVWIWQDFERQGGSISDLMSDADQ